MSDLTIKTNHHWREFVYRYDVPAAVLADQFDWTNEEDYSDGFFCYRGYWYHTADFMRNTDSDVDWHGYTSDSWFSGVLIRLSSDGERYQIGTYFS